MKYLCLIYQDESVSQKLPKAEAEKIHGQYLAFTDEIKKSGRGLGNNGLHHGRRPRSEYPKPKVTTSDGPFAGRSNSATTTSLRPGPPAGAIQVAARRSLSSLWKYRGQASLGDTTELGSRVWIFSFLPSKSPRG
jgi:hypothetical protein